MQSCIFHDGTELLKEAQLRRFDLEERGWAIAIAHVRAFVIVDTKELLEALTYLKAHKKHVQAERTVRRITPRHLRPSRVSSR